MTYQALTKKMVRFQGVEESTMMGTHCLRYKGDFFTMWFDKANSLIVKLLAERVTELIELGEGNPFNFTRKQFKEWVLIPAGRSGDFEKLAREALKFARSKK